MSNKNQKVFEQMRRLTIDAKKFYAHNYNPGSLFPPRDTKFLLGEEYIPFDFETDYDDPLYTEYRRVRMLKNPFEDEKEDKNSLQDISDDLVKDDNINENYKYQNDYQNIEASAALLKRLSQTQDNPNNLLAIGTLWNNISANKINKIGVRIDDAYRRKLWEDKRISDNINNPYKTILNGIYDRTGFYGYEIPQGVSHKYNANYFFDNILPSERN